MEDPFVCQKAAKTAVIALLEAGSKSQEHRKGSLLPGIQGVRAGGDHMEKTAHELDLRGCE